MKLAYEKNGQLKEIDSPYATHAEAFAALSTAIDEGRETGDFASSIANTYLKVFVQKKWRFMSDAKLYWLHALTMPKAQPVAEANYNMSGVLRMFATAKEHLKRPGIKLTVDGRDLKIYPAGPKSNYTGQLMVAGARYGEGWYGRIDQSGNFFPGKDCNDKVRELLRSLEENPEATAAAYGRLTGKCCFCNRSLEDDNSTAVGYGPVCAKHFGLDWGTKHTRTVKAVRSRRAITV